MDRDTEIKNITANEIDGVYCLPGVNDVKMAHNAAEKAIQALNAAGYRIIQFRVVERAPLVFDIETPPLTTEQIEAQKP